jgi:Ala-tRNA(Pro) deacylase
MPMDEKQKVFALLEAMDIPYRAVDHPAVFTIEEMERLKIDHMDKVVKNLFLRDDKKRNFYLVAMKNDKSANLKELRHRIGSRPLTFAGEDDLRLRLGLGKGEVTPFGAINDAENMVTVIIDNDLAELEFIGIHPNDNTATVYLAVNDLVKVLGTKNQNMMFIDI